MVGEANSGGAIETPDGLPMRSEDRPVQQTPTVRHQRATDAILQPRIPPPPDYYRDNLLRVLEHVWNRYADLLDSEAAHFIDKVGAASRLAQRLYARLVTRKGPYIRLDRLQYREIHDLPGAVDELVRTGLVQCNAEAPAETLLALFTKGELTALFDRRAATKKALLRDILERHPETAIRERLRGSTDWLCLADRQSLDLLQLLFFGNSSLGGPHRDLTTFVLEDLGTLRFENYRVSLDQRLFNDRRELQRYCAARDLHELSRRADEDADTADAVLAAIMALPDAPARLEKRLLDRTLNRLGRWFERTGNADQALACYARSRSHPARERRVRILTKLGDEATAQTLLDEITADPLGPEEQNFAARFRGRRTAPTPPVTQVPLETGRAGSIETQALDRLQASGGEGWHLENRLPLGLAGLAFWNVVFAPVDRAFLNPYQAGPLDLFWEDFAIQRRALLAATTAVLAEPERFARTLRATLEDKAGTVNCLVSWNHLDRYRLDRILETVPHGVLFPLVCHMIENLWRARTGFPDLLVLYGARDYEFVEVKGPNDQLQPAQRAWFSYFQRNGCNARVLKFKAMGA